MTLIWTTYTENFTGAASLSGPAVAYLPMVTLRARLMWPGVTRWWRSGGSLLTFRVALVLTALLGLVFIRRGLEPAWLMMAAITLAAVLASMMGFAFSAVCGAMLFHLSADPVHVVQIMMICSVANQVAMSWAVRHDTDWRWVVFFLAAGLPGVPLGAWLLVHVEPSLCIHGLGALLVGYSTYMLFRKPVTIVRDLPAVDAAVACISGITGGLAGFPSGALTIWCGMKGWDKARQRGIYQPFILLTQVLGLVMVSLFRSGGSGMGFNPPDLLFVPASLLGASVGFSLYRRLSDTQFARCMSLSLLVSGVSFVI